MPRRLRKVLLILGIVLIGAVVLWRMPGCQIDPVQLDYVRAFDDPAMRSIIIVAAFDAGSFAVIDSCTHQWQGGDLTIEFRSKMFLARNGRSIRIGAFRIPYPATGAAPASLRLRGGREPSIIEIKPMSAGFTPLVSVIGSAQR